MARQESIPPAANVLGTIGTICWCIQLVPQIWANWRKKKTDGLPSTMMFLWAACGVPFGVYDIVQNFNIPLQIQPQVFTALTLVSWAQTLIYARGWSITKATLLAVCIGAIFAGLEVLLILTLEIPYDRGITWPVTLVGIIAAILLAVGLVPPYFELAKRRGRVIGLSFVFLTVDCSGAFFSLLALVAQNTFDILGGILYIICILMELGIFTSHWIWLFRTRHIRRRAKAAGVKFDDFAEAQEFQSKGRECQNDETSTTSCPSGDLELGIDSKDLQVADAAADPAP